ncbi:fimbrial protein [Cupriavidus agavae]|uniref:Type 1 fimbria pilin n=1 Tax=Cupriavidus agavae TaxID=1001822 RepID=A0A4Q7S900_9BURK|nr:fimbrial protein [Cupriavidus agavae]RZT42934.1 type 1 fimbria pilin [Cupriavidus agavae]
MKLLRPLLGLALAVAGFASAPSAWAACSIVSNGGQPLRAEVRVDSITAATAGVAGTVLATRDIPLSQIEYTCGANVNAELRTTLATGSAATAVDNVYSTSIPGLGYRLRWPSSTWWPNALRCSGTQSGNCSVPASTLRVEFVQTGRISAGTLPAGTLGVATLLAPSTSSSPLTALTVSLMNPITIAVNTCSVTSDVRVDLGNYTVAEIEARGGSNVVPFQLAFNCPNPASVGITFNGTAPFAGGVNGLIQNDGTAGGVAVRLLDDSGLLGVRLGREVALGQISGARTFDYNARMYPIRGETLSPGSVDAFVVFTLNIR